MNNIKNKDEMPRERLIKFGPESLSLSELLCVLLQTGVKNNDVFKLANEVIYSIEDFTTITIEELCKFEGIGKSKAALILSALEFGKRVCRPKILDVKLDNFNNLTKYLHNKYSYLEQEHVYAIYLNIRGYIICEKLITIGDMSNANFDVREIIKWGIRNSAFAFVLLHNHPSGESNPSNADIKVTNQIDEITKMFDLKFLEHFIVGKNNCFAVKERKHYIYE